MTPTSGTPVPGTSLRACSKKERVRALSYGGASGVRESHAFDATKLDLDLAVVTFPGHDRPEQLMTILRGTDRVIRIYEGYDLDLLAIMVYDSAAECRRLQTLLEEHEPRLQWVVLRDVDDSPAASTWLSLAHRVAAQEDLLIK